MARTIPNGAGSTHPGLSVRRVENVQFEFDVVFEFGMEPDMELVVGLKTVVAFEQVAMLFMHTVWALIVPGPVKPLTD